MRRITSLLTPFLIVIVVAATGVTYNFLFSNGQTPFVGATFALFCGIPMLMFGRGMLFPRLYLRMHRLPTPGFILSGLVINFALISLGFAAAGTFLKLVGVMKGTWAQVTLLPMNVFLYALVTSAVIVFVLRVRELLGRDVFTSLLTGRYRNPVPEERVFLFIDLVGSTAIAEEMGDLRTQQFLGSLFKAFAEPVRRHQGAIDDYIGDAAIITWPMARGIAQARCIRCVFAILDDIEANAGQWLKAYGRVPRLRAALHGGGIITAEIGVDHHKITYFGDTVNTTARLESLSKALGKSFLVSADLAARVTMPAWVTVEDLGEHAVKGRGQTIGVMAIERMDIASVGAAERHRGIETARR